MANLQLAATGIQSASPREAQSQWVFEGDNTAAAIKRGGGKGDLRNTESREARGSPRITTLSFRMPVSLPRVPPVGRGAVCRNPGRASLAVKDCQLGREDRLHSIPTMVTAPWIVRVLSAAGKLGEPSVCSFKPPTPSKLKGPESPVWGFLSCIATPLFAVLDMQFRFSLLRTWTAARSTQGLSEWAARERSWPQEAVLNLNTQFVTTLN
ncbi:hypothetical protein X797_005924 [Metarhizium robertsii]|uniref:Uncharacterized protein n=1 Tax=Metarhizium robertsii TaxID=568076 RepID=A0A0A1UUL6_9HYPO|nr:hypothetical protein X797_005924 [Metarhizium robertsii]